MKFLKELFIELRLMDSASLGQFVTCLALAALAFTVFVVIPVMEAL